MIKRIIIVGGLFLLSTGVVLAYLGQHNFTGTTTNGATGETYESTYNTQGSFPYNGTGSFDGAKVNLQGVYTLVSRNNISDGSQYCVKTTGSINRKGRGKLTEKIYADVNCQVYQSTATLTVKSFSEDSNGNVVMVVTDSNGVTYTTTGSHSYN